MSDIHLNAYLKGNSKKGVIITAKLWFIVKWQLLWMITNGLVINVTYTYFMLYFWFASILFLLTVIIYILDNKHKQQQQQNFIIFMCINFRLAKLEVLSMKTVAFTRKSSFRYSGRTLKKKGKYVIDKKVI